MKVAYTVCLRSVVSDLMRHRLGTVINVLPPAEANAGPNERLNKEIRRRTDLVGICPDRATVTRLVGAVLAEQHDEWAEGRRYFALDVLHRARLNLITDTTPELQEQPLALTA